MMKARLAVEKRESGTLYLVTNFWQPGRYSRDSLPMMEGTSTEMSRLTSSDTCRQGEYHMGWLEVMVSRWPLHTQSRAACLRVPGLAGGGRCH